MDLLEDWPAAEAVLRDLDVGIIPVVESDTNKRLKGVLTDRDIVVEGLANELDPARTGRGIDHVPVGE